MLAALAAEQPLRANGHERAQMIDDALTWAATAFAAGEIGASELFEELVPYQATFAL